MSRDHTLPAKQAPERTSASSGVLPRAGLGNQQRCAELGLGGSGYATYPTRPGDTWAFVAAAAGAAGQEDTLRELNPGVGERLEPCELLAIPPHWNAALLPGAGVAPTDDVERFSQLLMAHRGPLDELPVAPESLTANEQAALIVAIRHHHGARQARTYGLWMTTSQGRVHPYERAAQVDRPPTGSALPGLLPPLFTAAGSTGVEIADAFLQGVWIELDAQWRRQAPERLQAVRESLARAGLVQAAFPPVGVAGIVHGAFAEAYEALKTILELDELFAALSDLVEALFSDQGAEVAHALGRDTVARGIQEFEAVVKMSPAQVAYWVGYRAAPVVADLLLALLGVGAAVLALRALRVGGNWLLESVDGLADLRRRLRDLELAPVGPDASDIAFEARRAERGRGRTPQPGRPEGRRRTVRRPNPTRPLREPDPSAQPRGPKTEIPEGANVEQRRSLERENAAARQLAQAGYDVERNPRLSTEELEALGLNGRGRPDYLVNGTVFDCVAPRYTTSVRNIFGAVKKKVEEKQTRRVLVNLDDSHKRIPELRDHFRANAHEDWVGRLDEVLALKNGTVHRIFPP